MLRIDSVCTALATLSRSRLCAAAELAELCCCVAASLGDGAVGEVVAKSRGVTYSEDTLQVRRIFKASKVGLHDTIIAVLSASCVSHPIRCKAVVRAVLRFILSHRLNLR